MRGKSKKTDSETIPMSIKAMKKTNSRGRKENKQPDSFMKRMSDGDIAKKIAIGATGVALTAGVVAAGAVLIDKRNRDRMSKGALKAIDTLKVVASDFAEEDGRYQAVSHRLGMDKKGKKKTTSRSKSR